MKKLVVLLMVLCSYTIQMSVACGCYKADLDRDGYIGIADVVAFAESDSFGSTPENPRWNSYYDIDWDGYIGIKDLVTILNCFGTEVDY